MATRTTTPTTSTIAPRPSTPSSTPAATSTPAASTSASGAAKPAAAATPAAPPSILTGGPLGVFVYSNSAGVMIYGEPEQLTDIASKTPAITHLSGTDSWGAHIKCHNVGGALTLLLRAGYRYAHEQSINGAKGMAVWYKGV